MKRDFFCIMACGGHGTRMGTSIPKQFLRIGNRTILQMTMERVALAVPGIRFVLVLPEEYLEFWKEECKKSSITMNQVFVAGGITRFHSVRNALARIPDGAIVGVHDAVRPFAGEKLISTLFKAAESCPAVIPVIPVTDTLKVLDENLNEMEGRTADRSRLFGAQTPQVFDASALKQAYSLPYRREFTDDASVMRAAGYPVKYIPGEKYNIKITTPEDLLFAGAVSSLF